MNVDVARLIASDEVVCNHMTVCLYSTAIYK